MNDREFLEPWSERRATRTEAERAATARAYSMNLPPLPDFHVWSEADLDALKAAFVKRFDEDLPRTETLMAVAAVGYRMALRDAERTKNEQ